MCIYIHNYKKKLAKTQKTQKKGDETLFRTQKKVVLFTVFAYNRSVERKKTVYFNTVIYIEGVKNGENIIPGKRFRVS